jgi:hypothetical protein
MGFPADHKRLPIAYAGDRYSDCAGHSVRTHDGMASCPDHTSRPKRAGGSCQVCRPRFFLAICSAICVSIGRSLGNDMTGISDMGLGFAIAVTHSFPGRSD